MDTIGQIEIIIQAAFIKFIYLQCTLTMLSRRNELTRYIVAMKDVSLAGIKSIIWQIVRDNFE